MPFVEKVDNFWKGIRNFDISFSNQLVFFRPYHKVSDLGNDCFFFSFHFLIWLAKSLDNLLEGLAEVLKALLLITIILAIVPHKKLYKAYTLELQNTSIQAFEEFNSAVIKTGTTIASPLVDSAAILSNLAATAYQIIK